MFQAKISAIGFPVEPFHEHLIIPPQPWRLLLASTTPLANNSKYGALGTEKSWMVQHQYQAETNP